MYSDGIANSVDPDQTAWNSLTWVCTICTDLYGQIVRIFMVSLFV